jgi:hypothetical protein
MSTVIEPEEISVINKSKNDDILTDHDQNMVDDTEQDIPTDEEIESLEQFQKNSLKNPEKLKKTKKSKKNLWIIVIAILLLLSVILVGLYFVNNLFNSTKSSSNSTSTGQTGNFTLIKEYGEVFFKEGLNSYTQLDADEKNLPSESFVKVGNGLAHVLFANNSLVSLDSNSEIQIKTDATGINIDQLAGSTWNRVKKLTSGESYKVKTPSALATVRGTKFGVELSKKNPRDLSGFYTTEGTITVGQLGKDNQEVTKDEVVSPGFIEIKPIGQDNAISKGNLLAQDIQGRWYMRNRVIDKLFDARSRIDIIDFIKNIRSSGDLQRITKDNQSNTKKENCLELLDQSNIIKQDAGFIKISSPKDASEFKPSDTITFTSSSTDPCTTKPFDTEKIRWYLNTSVSPFGTGSTAIQKDLTPGEYNVTVKVSVAGKELSDSIRFKIIGPSSSSSSSSKVVVNQAPVVKITSPQEGAIVTAIETNLTPANTYKYQFTISVTATDPEDGIIPGNKITWLASGAGAGSSGDGTNYTVYCYRYVAPNAAVVPPPTPCTITVTATDSGGKSSSDTITIKIVN